MTFKPGEIYICPISWKPCLNADGTAMDSKWHADLIKSIGEELSFAESDKLADETGRIETYFSCMLTNDYGDCLIRETLELIASFGTEEDKRLRVDAIIEGDVEAHIGGSIDTYEQN